MTKPYTRIVSAALAASLMLVLAAVRFGPALAFSIELAIPATDRWFAPVVGPGASFALAGLFVLLQPTAAGVPPLLALVEPTSTPPSASST